VWRAALVLALAVSLTGQSTVPITAVWDLDGSHDGVTTWELEADGVVASCGNLEVLATERRCSASVADTARLFRLRGIRETTEGPLVGAWSAYVSTQEGPGPFSINFAGELEPVAMAFGDIIQTKTATSGGNTAVQATFDTTPVVGNLIVAIAFTGDGPLTPSGDLIELIDHHDTGQDDGFSIGYRVVQSGDGSTWGFTQPSADEFGIVIREFEGPWETTPADQTGTTAFANTISTQLVTTAGATSQNDEVAVAGWGYRSGTASDLDRVTSVDDGFGNISNPPLAPILQFRSPYPLIKRP
jgi:hypothetical protein